MLSFLLNISIIGGGALFENGYNTVLLAAIFQIECSFVNFQMMFFIKFTILFKAVNCGPNLSNFEFFSVMYVIGATPWIMI